jgi:rare lipoprotein A
MNISDRFPYQRFHSNGRSFRSDRWNCIIVVILTLILSSCASSPRFTKERYAEPKINSSKPGPDNTNGKAIMYKGIASYYGRDFHGKKTANGELFDMHGLSAAHRSFPFGTKVRVTNIDHGKSCVVRVNDRGPFKLELIMDLSVGAAELLDMMKSGTANVTLEVLEWGE